MGRGRRGEGPEGYQQVSAGQKKRLRLRKLPRKDKTREVPGHRASSQGREEGGGQEGEWGLRQWPSVGDSVLPLQVAWVPPLVKEPRSRTPCSVAKTKKINE